MVYLFPYRNCGENEIHKGTQQSSLSSKVNIDFKKMSQIYHFFFFTFYFLQTFIYLAVPHLSWGIRDL